MIVYHGSPHQFEKFDYGKIRENGTQEGIGFYFTDHKDIAERYGKDGFLYTTKFKGKKPLSSEKLTISRSAFKKFIKKLHQETDYLSNWGDVEYEGLNAVIEAAVSGEYNYTENDVDLICGIANASGSFEKTLRICFETLGYDSIITKTDWGNDQTIYIALVEEAYEIISCEQMTGRDGQ